MNRNLRNPVGSRGSVHFEYCLLAGLAALGVVFGLSRVAHSTEASLRAAACGLLARISDNSRLDCGATGGRERDLLKQPNPLPVAPTEPDGDSFQVVDASIGRSVAAFEVEAPSPSPGYAQQLRRALSAACSWPGAACPAGNIDELSDADVVVQLSENTNSVVLSPERYRAAFENYEITKSAWRSALETGRFLARQRGEANGSWKQEDVVMEFAANLRRHDSDSANPYLESLAADAELAGQWSTLVDVLVEHGLAVDEGLFRITGTLPVPPSVFWDIGQQVFDGRLDPALKAPMAYRFEEGASKRGFHHRGSSAGVFVNEYLQADPAIEFAVLADETGHYFFSELYPDCRGAACRQIDEAGSFAMNLLVLPSQAFSGMVSPALTERYPPYDASARRILSDYWARTNDWNFVDRTLEQLRRGASQNTWRVGAGLPAGSGEAEGKERSLTRDELFTELVRIDREMEAVIVGEAAGRLPGGLAVLSERFLKAQHAIYDRLDAGLVPYLSQRGDIAWKRPAR